MVLFCTDFDLRRIPDFPYQYFYTNIVFKINFVIFHISYYDKFSVAYDLHLFQSAMDVILNSISDPIFAVSGEALSTVW